MKLKYIILGILLSGISVGYCAPPEIHLSGTMKSQHEQVAYIQGSVYRVNDDISGYRIKGINDLGITLQQEGSSDVYFVGIGDLSNIHLIEESNAIPETASSVENVTSSVENVISLIPESQPDLSPSKKKAEGDIYDVSRIVLAIILLLVGLVLTLIGSITFLIASFRESIWWGLGILFLPFVGMVFLIMHWSVAAKPLGIYMLGFVFCIIAAIIAPGAWSTYSF